MKVFIRFIFILFIFSNLVSCCPTKKTQSDEDYNAIDYGKYIKNNKKPQKFIKDLVPDEATAIKIADIIWDSRFGKYKIMRDLPYTVVLEDEKVWYVKTNLPNGMDGKVFHIKISKYDAKILYLWSEG